MAQAQLDTYAVDAQFGTLMPRLRSAEIVLWFPDAGRPETVEFAPRSRIEEEQDADSNPWLVRALGQQSRYRLTTQELQGRLSTSAYEELPDPRRCAACDTPLPPNRVVESQHDRVTGAFCSGECLHDCEATIRVTLTPTRERTGEASALLRVQWRENERDRADEHLPRWSM